MNYKDNIKNLLNIKKDELCAISDKIWDLAETKFQEMMSSTILSQKLREENFEVKSFIANMPTAFVAKYGEGKPVIGLLLEYDAVPFMSQRKEHLEEIAVYQDSNGHACGKNLVSAGVLGAGIVIKELMKENSLKGTIKIYGCPGNEDGAGKTFMVREGVFSDLDCALTFKPNGFNAVNNFKTLANKQFLIRFKGRALHAFKYNHISKNALNAIEIMNIGINYLKNNLQENNNINYAITRSGGSSPNVLKSEVEGIYSIRANNEIELDKIYYRVCDIAKGAALITNTEYEIVFDKACLDYIPNNTLGRVIDKYLEEDIYEFDSNDKDFAKAIFDTFDEDIKSVNLEILKTRFEKLSFDEYLISNKFEYKEDLGVIDEVTDIADVSWIIPVSNFYKTCFSFLTPYYSWQMVSQSSTEMANKGMLNASNVLALTVLDLLQNPNLIDMAKQEHKEYLGDRKYNCPIPKDIKPSLIKGS
ncbi:amidohydrolase [Peptostreptococcaceae bacterium AGR-M142]